VEITLENLRRYSMEGFYNSRNPQVQTLKYMTDEIIKVIDTTKIKVVYPKNLFIDNKQIELYLFDDGDHILKITYENKEVCIFLYLLKDITRLKNSVNYENKSRSLTIEFSNGEIFEFNSASDTNSYHMHRFEDLIIDIWKSFIKFGTSNNKK
jgi:hypothetical protein